MKDEYSTVWVGTDHYLLKDNLAIAKAIHPFGLGLPRGSRGTLDEICEQMNKAKVQDVVDPIKANT